MRNVPIDAVDAIARPVLAIGTDYPLGQLLPTHSHRRAQFLYGATGVMEVGTDDGAWVVPPQRGVWIPAGQPHRVRMLGVSTRSLYIEPREAPRHGRQCEVLEVSPLLRQLLLAAVE
ncbi:AraC family ligand binding domain-containing protein, partial [Variovorax paradoxus]